MITSNNPRLRIIDLLDHLNVEEHHAFEQALESLVELKRGSNLGFTGFVVVTADSNAAMAMHGQLCDDSMSSPIDDLRAYGTAEMFYVLNVKMVGKV